MHACVQIEGDCQVKEIKKKAEWDCWLGKRGGAFVCLGFETNMAFFPMRVVIGVDSSIRF